ncbi:septation ring formation regulator [Alteribacillus persepolensis]|uniref:Septation ring formation regulator n=1 Tax=Alteribacillus persepolensis TaxID=568899 RepID=A0A1G8BFI1_9BACI|nr:septation ring formation regulator EzrA [Alteribacillus persepolensis]SDH31773.1 septation ring formation regulator [Alteribacillus persepolensis]
MMIYVITIAVVIIAGIIAFGAVSRKKIYKEVDKLEQWKTKIANQPVADEIARVKGLTMSGETEAKFEEWRQEWEEIVGVRLPDIEEWFFDIEELANKYKFKAARSLLKEARQQLTDIDHHITAIFNEVEELVSSEQENRVGIDDIKERLEKLGQYVAENRLALDESVRLFEKRLQEYKENVRLFEKETEAGNHLKASQLLTEWSNDLSQTESQVKQVPAMLVDVEANLREECKEVIMGIEEMEKAGYTLEHLPFRSYLEDVMDELPSIKKAVISLELEKAEKRLEEIHDYIEYIYQTLENEVEARQYVEAETANVRQDVKRVETLLDELEDEREKVQQSYRIPDEDETRYYNTESRIEEALKTWRVFQDMYHQRKQSFTALKESLDAIKKDIHTLENQVRTLKEKLFSLRKDEVSALETLKTLRRQMLQDRMRLERSLLPKVPSALLNEVDAAENKLVSAAEALGEIPVEMGKVNTAIDDAKHSVQKVHQQLMTTLEQANLAEQAIQHGNKYRSESEAIDEQLLKAEEHFRKGYYDEAVYTAVGAVKRKEPHLLEQLQNGDKVN